MSFDLKLPGPGVAIIDPSLQDIRIEIPRGLRTPLHANRRLLPRFAAAVVDAVKASLEHPDTKMRSDVTAREVRRRTELCYEALYILYWEEKVSLIQALDILENVLIDTLRMDYGTGMVTDGRGRTPQARRWGLKGRDEVCEADLTSSALEVEDA